MRTDADGGVPARGHQGWTSATAAHAANQLRDRLRGRVDLTEVAEVGGEYFRQVFVARTVTVTRHHDGRYQDIVNVGHLPPGEEHRPQNLMYAQSIYPVSTEQLITRGGYFTSDMTDPRFREFIDDLPDPEVGSLMGVAMTTSGELHGEIFLTRRVGETPFDHADLVLAVDLGTVLGSTLLTAEAHAERQRHRP